MGLTTRALAYFDTNIVIRLLEERDENIRTFLQSLRAEGGSVVTSELTLAETLVVPLEHGDTAMIDTYEVFLSTGDGVIMVPIDRPVLREAASLRAQFKSMKTPDAIHVASALAAGCTVFVTSDRRVRAPKELKVIGASDLAEWRARG